MPEIQTWPFLLAVGLKFLGHKELSFFAKHFLGDEVGSPCHVHTPPSFKSFLSESERLRRGKSRNNISTKLQKL